MFRFSRVMIATICVMFFVLVLRSAYAEYICGDANSDASLNVSDAVYIINHVFVNGPGPDPGCCESGCPTTMTDIDGNTYFTVKIGDQCWMAENLEVTHYRNGDPITNVSDAAEWSALSTEAYCDYDNNPVNAAIYGRLYNWYAISDSRNIAPEGWHVPSDEEIKQLEMYLGMSQEDADATSLRGTDEGGKLKEIGTTHWDNPNAGASNLSSFTALPGGHRSFEGEFLNISENAALWSSTEYSSLHAWFRYLGDYTSQVIRNHNGKKWGYSVRCVKD